MVFEYSIGHGADALFWNQIIEAFNETYWLSGFDASTGGGSFEVDLTSGTGTVAGGSVSGSSQTVALNSSNANPRKDVVYINGSGNAQTLTGTAVAAAPAGEVRANTYQPAPPDAAGITGFVVAEVWVPGGSSDITSSDIRDRRLPRPTYTDEDAQDAVGTVLSSQFTYDDAGNAINLDPHKNNATAHHSQPASTQSATSTATSVHTQTVNFTNGFATNVSVPNVVGQAVHITGNGRFTKVDTNEMSTFTRDSGDDQANFLTIPRATITSISCGSGQTNDFSETLTIYDEGVGPHSHSI
jgi:hypothetical protein